MHGVEVEVCSDEIMIDQDRKSFKRVSYQKLRKMKKLSSYVKLALELLVY